MEAEAGGSSRHSRRQAPRSSLPSPPPISTQRVNTFNPLEGSPFVSNGTDDAIMRVVGVASDGGDKDGDDELHLGSKGDNAEIENKEGGIACQVSRRGNTPTAVLPLQTESEARLAGSLIQLVRVTRPPRVRRMKYGSTTVPQLLRAPTFPSLTKILERFLVLDHRAEPCM